MRSGCHHRTLKPQLSDYNAQAGSGGLFTGTAAESVTNVSHATRAAIGDGAKIAVVGSVYDPGTFSVNAYNELDAHDRVKNEAYGLIQGAGATSVIRAGYDEVFGELEGPEADFKESSEGEEEAGNRVSMILFHLPIQSDDPVERLLAIHAETERAKAEHRRAGGDVLRQLTDVVTSVAAPWLLTHAMQLYSSSQLADRLPVFSNLVVSNLPGPAVPLYCGRARVARVYPLGPVQQGSGLNLTVLSVMDRLCFGALACKKLVPDVEDLATGFVDASEELRRLAERRPR